VKVAAAPVSRKKSFYGSQNASALSFAGSGNTTSGNNSGIQIIKKSIINVIEGSNNGLNQTQKVMIPKKGPIKVLK